MAWYLTGTDDFLVFYSIYYSTEIPKNHRLAVFGLVAAVLLMITIVVVSNIIVMIIPIIQKYTFLGGIIPIYLGVNTIISDDDETKTDLNKSSFFLLAFLGFILNSGDDIIFNLSIILSRGFLYQFFFLTGIFFGALSMIWIIAKLHKTVKKDFPVLRGIVLIIIGVALLFSNFITF